ncbi:hydroxymethylpyrimidine/phosphomethylpyrimidine kinase [Accumulibacter sp.]|uniref:bifunctional hydroxymethylpyrimidine kinase/phosphomethylpyrimidine kinase n=1 Tax=Accumulibacter sp. TaxID=2053492 RepID=UPI0025D0A3D2|nr:hydroxymethylpyrimidine/phosphomethylpyrimidine kinase [Accumulibacter sp.]MCM8594434.1 hydroxymethylpyrimidine/phosphomethylpyrimidine kinase [Accumulibacter sp.]MCM8624930.1 hydroxymethylpyrimidine/phosphomethylpyrimidine kinase [Accumulibacter sp.]MDS4048579.1 hydroxymethylpyrimidine/phosphomethylpyrimidine kinase [Accumulibacter sp.]
MNRRPVRPAPPIVLVFSANDPSGGAGIEADLLTVAALGCHPLPVITALTVQDTVGVGKVLAVDADCVEEQARAVLEDMRVAALKVGLAGSAENIRTIAGIAGDYPEIPLVVDPVLASGRGDDLVDDEMIDGLREILIPQTTVLTPNSLEARRLVERAGDNDIQTLEACAQALLELGCEYVLLTGTHDNTARVVNRLYERGLGLLRSDDWDRLPGSYHGSGCTLASAVAAHLARGLAVDDAVRAAQDYTWRTLAAGFRPGMGQIIPDRLFSTHPYRGGLDA